MDESDAEEQSGFPPKDFGATVLCRHDALRLWHEGQDVPCPQCEVSEIASRANELRSHGIGKIKVGIVLYGGENESAERVGECVPRDLLDLRDPNEPSVEQSPRGGRTQRSQASERSRGLPATPAAPDRDQREQSERNNCLSRIVFPFTGRSWLNPPSEGSLYPRVSHIHNPAMEQAPRRPHTPTNARMATIMKNVTKQYQV